MNNEDTDSYGITSKNIENLSVFPENLDKNCSLEENADHKNILLETNQELGSLEKENNKKEVPSFCSDSLTKKGDFMELIKARLSFLVLVTTLIGFLVAWNGPLDYKLLIATLLGTAAAASGAAALNQWWERRLDALMKRTEDRPLPSQRMNPKEALMIGLFLSFFGTALLALLVNFLAAFLALLTVLIYILAYTPLKKRTSLNTLMGAIPGALPPVIGWVAARETISLEAVILFLILWFWQMPHFLAIAWLYREDYAAAGFKMISLDDLDGLRTARQAFLYTLGLIAISLFPPLFGLTSLFYLFVALALGILFLLVAGEFLLKRNDKHAKRLFFFSIIYLPLILLALLFFKTTKVQLLESTTSSEEKTLSISL